MTNLLRAHRLYLLSDLESGNFSLASLARIRSQLDGFWYILIISGGTFLLSSPYSTYLIYCNESQNSALENLEMYKIFTGTVISFECFLLVIFLIPLINRSIPVVLKIELFFQLICWSSALFVLENPIEQRFFYLIPIRNFIMMVIILMAIYEINKNFKPPLPPEIDLDLVLENEDLYLAFKRYLTNRKLVASNEYLNLLLKIRIFKDSPSEFNRKVLALEVNNSMSLGHLLRETLDNDIEKGIVDGFIEAESFLFSNLEGGPFTDFKTSDEFIDLLSEY